MADKEIEELTVKQGQQRDAEKHKTFDREMDAYRRGKENLTDEERIDRLKDNADLRNRLNKNIQSTAFEVGAGGVVDWATTPLMAAPPVYAGVNFIAGSAINTLAQLWRQDDNFSWGEVAASGAVGVVPGLGGKATIAKGAIKGAASGVAHEAIRIGIDEKRLPTAEEAVVGGTVGGVVGGGVTGAKKGGSTLKDRLLNRIDYDEILDPNVVFRPGSKEDIFRQRNVVYGMSPESSDFSSMHWATPSLRQEGPYILRANKKRVITSELTTGQKVTPEVIKDFESEGIKQANELSKRFGVDIGKVNIHHKGVLRQIFESMNGLDDEHIAKSVKYYESRLGFKLGYSPENAIALPDSFHPRLHALINSQISSNPWSWNLKGIENKFKLSPDWKNYTEYGQRLKIYREMARVIGDSLRQTNRLWDNVSARTNKLGKLSKEEYMNTVFDLLELDKNLKGLPSPHFMVKQEFAGIETGSDVINDILKRAGRIDLSLPSFQKLSVNDTKAVAKIKMQDNGAEALLEAIQSNQSADTVFKSYKLVFTENRKTWNRILNLIDIKDLQRSLRGGVSGGRDLSPGMRADD